MNALKAMYTKCMNKEELNAIGSTQLIESIKIDQGDLGLGDSTRDYYLDKEKHGKKISAYRQLLINTMAFFLEESNLPKNETKIEQDVDKIIDLETKLAKILVPDEDRTNYSELCNLRRLNDLQKLMPLVNWTRYFHSVAPYVVHDYLGSNPEILIMEINFMRRITNLLQSTDPRIITNYIYMRYSSAWTGELGERYEYIDQDSACGKAIKEVLNVKRVSDDLIGPG
ncbi:hypothetical protein RB195_019099 [Necator americanus]|uniref:Peptidase M13 N-terminal domain-containing protein n=1 Tax=Necator americanus TaxID=51031 RepID=A0ABR1CF98_NECAM